MRQTLGSFAHPLTLRSDYRTRRAADVLRRPVFRLRRPPRKSRLLRFSAIQVNTVSGNNDGEVTAEEIHKSYSVGVTIVSGYDEELRRRVIENIVVGCTGKRVVVVTASGITSTREQDGVAYESVEKETSANTEASTEVGGEFDEALPSDKQGAPDNLEGWLSCSSYEEMAEVITKLASSREYDYIVAEGATSTRFGPHEIASLFHRKGGASLRVDTLVSVLDGTRVLNDLRTNRPAETVPDPVDALEDSDSGSFSSSQDEVQDEPPLQDQSTSTPMLIVSLVENANVIVLNHEEEDESVAELEPVQNVLSVLNRRANILHSKSCSISIDDVVNTNRYDSEDLFLSASWKVMLLADRTDSSKQLPKSVKDSTFVYRARRPFHPQRLFEQLRTVQTFSGVIRSTGKIWLATRMLAPLEWNQAGESATLQLGKRFFAALPEAEWPSDEKVRKKITEKWDTQFGDRETELVFVGISIEKDRLQGLLDGCLLQDEEMVFTNLWENFEDPFEEFVPSEEELEELQIQEEISESSPEPISEQAKEPEVQEKLTEQVSETLPVSKPLNGTPESVSADSVSIEGQNSKAISTEDSNPGPATAVATEGDDLNNNAGEQAEGRRQASVGKVEPDINNVGNKKEGTIIEDKSEGDSGDGRQGRSSGR